MMDYFAGKPAICGLKLVYLGLSKPRPLPEVKFQHSDEALLGAIGLEP